MRRTASQSPLPFGSSGRPSRQRRYEQAARSEGYRWIAGLDEAGRGPLAGPVVGAAVILDPRRPIRGLDDSKKLQPRKRERLYRKIVERAVSIGVAVVDSSEIDRTDILRASLRAMAIAAEGLRPAADFLLVDGRFPVPLRRPQRPIIRGDALCRSISAASIVAKVSRDRIMQVFHERFPVYGFERNKGYGTPGHVRALRIHGRCAIHRVTFRGVL